MKEKNPFNLDVVSVRLVKDAPIMSGHPITKPEDAVLLLGKHLCEMDREVLCVINMKTDGTPIVLPQPAHSNAYLYEYLTNDRAISRDVVNFFVNQGLIYESMPYHNIVFKGNDKDGVTRFASMRGVFDKKGKPFKCDVPGNDKRYGFNIANEESTELVVFEAAIDLMSYMDIHRDFESNMIALGMVADAPLETFLKEHSQIETIRFCLDNDKPGRDATEILMEKYYQLGFDVTDSPPPKGCKDYNEWLVKARNEKQCNLYSKNREIP